MLKTQDKHGSMRNPWVRKLYRERQHLLLLVILAMTVLSVFGFQRFSFDNEARGLFRTNDSTFEELEQIFEQFRPMKTTVWWY